jgi:hypothetical protein
MKTLVDVHFSCWTFLEVLHVTSSYFAIWSEYSIKLMSRMHMGHLFVNRLAHDDDIHWWETIEIAQFDVLIVDMKLKNRMNLSKNFDVWWNTWSFLHCGNALTGRTHLGYFDN